MRRLWQCGELLRIPQSGESGRTAKRRRDDWRVRLHRMRLRAAGLTETEYASELQMAITAWYTVTFWRRVPRPVALAIFPYLGRRFTIRWFEAKA